MSQGLRVAALDRGHDRGDGAVQGKLNQHTGGRRHRTRHGIEKAAGAPVQQQAQHDEQKVIGMSPEMAEIAGLVENSWNSHPAASNTRKIVISGL